MNQQLRRAAYRTGMFFVSIALVAVLWELYKVVGPEKGGKLFGVQLGDGYGRLGATLSTLYGTCCDDAFFVVKM